MSTEIEKAREWLRKQGVGVTAVGYYKDHGTVCESGTRELAELLTAYASEQVEALRQVIAKTLESCAVDAENRIDGKPHCDQCADDAAAIRDAADEVARALTGEEHHE